MTDYEAKIVDAFKQCCAENAKRGLQGASASEVTAKMAALGTLARLDTVIDIVDQMQHLASRGYFSK